MERMISICGMVCSECPAYKATRDNDDAQRRATAEQWSKQFGSDIKPEDINCWGCLNTEGDLFNYCRICEIRKCGMAKGLENCAHCDEYGCEKLTKFFGMASEAKKNLEEIRASRK